jgi:VIT1/CCC1 family predicted Fe2+/Mn2+ transporter
MKHDALGSHARDELGISESFTARPVQAALASAGAFSVGAVLPLLLVFLAPTSVMMYVVSVGSLVFLILLGITAARVGGAPVIRSALRVGFWGAMAMIVTAVIGALFGAA